MSNQHNVGEIQLLEQHLQAIGMAPVRGIRWPRMIGLSIAKHIDSVDSAVCAGKLGYYLSPGICARHNIVEQHNCPICPVFGSLNNITQRVVNYMGRAPLRSIADL